MTRPTVAYLLYSSSSGLDRAENAMRLRPSPSFDRYQPDMRRTLERSGRSSKRDQGLGLADHASFNLVYKFDRQFLTYISSCLLYTELSLLPPTAPTLNIFSSFSLKLSLFPLLLGPLWITHATGPCSLLHQRTGEPNPHSNRSLKDTARTARGHCRASFWRGKISYSSAVEPSSAVCLSKPLTIFTLHPKSR